MGPGTKLDTARLQAIRNNIAPLIRELEEIGAEMPEHGQFVTFSKNHLRMAFMELGYGSALAKGLDPLANRVGNK